MAKKNDWSISFKTTNLPMALDTIAPAITNKTIWGNHLLLRIDQDDFSGFGVTATLIANNGLQEIRREIGFSEFQCDEIADREIELCLPYDPFVRALDGAASANVVVGPKTVHLTVPGPNGPASHATLNVIPNGPVYPEHTIGIENMITLENAGALYKAIGLAKVACSGLPSDTVRNAIRFQTNPHSSRIVLEAADSYHAARVYGPKIKENDYEDVPYIDINIPAQYVGSMKNMAGELYLAADANRVHVRCGKITWTSVLVDGKFPNIDQLVSSEPIALFRIKTATLRNRVKQASAFGNVTIATANVKYSRITLTLDPDDLTVAISADTSVYGSFSATESVVEVHAEPESFTSAAGVEINMDAAVLLKALSGIDGDEVEVAVIQEGRMISLSTEKESHFLATVLN